MFVTSYLYTGENRKPGVTILAISIIMAKINEQNMIGNLIFSRGANDCETCLWEKRVF